MAISNQMILMAKHNKIMITLMANHNQVMLILMVNDNQVMMILMPSMMANDIINR